MYTEKSVGEVWFYVIVSDFIVVEGFLSSDAKRSLVIVDEGSSLTWIADYKMVECRVL